MATVDSDNGSGRDPWARFERRHVGGAVQHVFRFDGMELRESDHDYLPFCDVG